MNYFSHETAADRYALSRPYFHPLIIERVREVLQLERPICAALDVACGTGQSSRALTTIAEAVLATDISPAMLAHAPAHPNIRYLLARAEQLPVRDASIDLITVSLAFHWFDRPRFLVEAHRTLRKGGLLVIYWNHFLGKMKENPTFEPWYDTNYFDRFPTPPRDNRPFTDEEAAARGFRFVLREKHTNEHPFTAELLAHNFTTHSNVIARVEQGNESLTEAHEWLLSSIQPFFHGRAGTFVFGGEIWILEAR